MPTVTTKDGTQIYYKDWSKGQPVVFSHGWPLSSDAWDGQLLFLPQNGYRGIARDRRGHGHWHGLASAARIDSRVGDRSVHRTEILPMDVARSGRRQTGQVAC
jgi:non-heme chloroperoxidase